MTYGSMDNAAVATGACIKVPREVFGWSWDEIMSWVAKGKEAVTGAVTGASEQVSSGMT